MALHEKIPGIGGKLRGEEREDRGRDGQHGRRLDPVKTCCQQVIHAVEKPEDFKE